MNTRFYQQGQSLVEVTIASAALIFGLVAVVSGLILSVRNATVSNVQIGANQQAQEVVEVFKKFQRELGWESFYSIVQADGVNFEYCINSLPTTTLEFQSLSVGSCSTTYGGFNFRRQAAIVVRSSTEIELTVTVNWVDGEENRSTYVRQILQQY